MYGPKKSPSKERQKPFPRNVSFQTPQVSIKSAAGSVGSASTATTAAAATGVFVLMQTIAHCAPAQ